MNDVRRNSIRFLTLLLIQVFLLNQIQLFGIAYPFLYIVFILFLPLRMPSWLATVLAFALGLTIDIFNDTLGLHAAAATLVAFIRPLILRRLTPQYDEEDEGYLDIYNRTLPQFLILALISCFVFCTAFFMLERFSSRGLFTTILQIVGSTLITFVLIVIYRYLFIPASSKRGA